MAKSKSKHSQDLRKSPNKKHKYPVEHMEVPAEEANENSLVYFDHKAREKSWMTEAKIERMGVELLQWAETPEATKLSKFFHARRITSKVVLDWCKKWPRFAEDYQLAKEIIGDRREDGALNKVFDAHFIRLSMPMYDEDWKNETTRVATLRDQEKHIEANRVLNVYMTEARSQEEIDADEKKNV